MPTRPPRKSSDLMLTGNRYSLHNAKSIIKMEKVKVTKDWPSLNVWDLFCLCNYHNWAIPIEFCTHGNIMAKVESFCFYFLLTCGF